MTSSNPEITVYGKPDCVQCKQTTKVLDRDNVGYTYVDVTENLDAFNAVQELGYRAAPVVAARVPGEPEDRTWSGFRPDLIKDLLVDSRVSAGAN